MVESFLESRQQCVKYHDYFSAYKPIRIGALQGTKLDPIPWLIYYVKDLTASDYNTMYQIMQMIQPFTSPLLTHPLRTYLIQ